jgi:hypothetical protein
MSIKNNFKFLFLNVILVYNCSSDDGNTSTTPDNSSVTIERISTFGGTRNESAQSVTKTSDGGYAVLGYAQSMDGDITDKQDESYSFWVLKFDAANQLQWSKTHGGTNDDRGNKIIQTTDGGFAILGYTNSNDQDVSNNAGLRDYWIAKLDASGNLTWQNSFGYSGLDSGISMVQTNDNGYMLVGVLDVTASGGEGNSRNSSERHAGGDYWAIKLNDGGQKEWSRYYGGFFTDTPSDVIQTQDNGFIIVGTSDSEDVDISNNKGTYDFWVLKIDSSGTILWEKNFGGTEIDEAESIVASGDGNFIIAGETRSMDVDVSQNNGAADVWIIKISHSGELIWEKNFGGSSFDVSRSVRKTQDNGFLISGSSRSSDGDVDINMGQNDAWFLKIDSNGALQWQKSIGGSNIDFAYDATQLNDGSFVIVGESASNDGDIQENKGFSDVLIIKGN